MRTEYPTLNIRPNLDQLADWIRTVTRSRGFDLRDYDDQVANTPRIYPTPSSSSDLIGTEKFGDIATGTDSGTEYIYIVVDNGGTKQWQRAALSTF